MNSDHYIAAAARTDVPSYDMVRERLDQEGNARILHALMGLVTETGEAMDALKKHIIYGKPLDRTNLGEELGDLFWYAALLARELGVSFDQVMASNIAKLRARYPDKFTEHHALNRDLDAERRILEGRSDT